MKKEKPYIKVNMVLSSKNFNKIDRMIMLCKKIGVQELALHPMREYFDSINLTSLLLNEKEKQLLKKILERCEKLAKKVGIKLNKDMLELESLERKKEKKEIFSDIRKKIEKCSCFEPLYTIFIDAEGLVNGCSPSGKGKNELDTKKMSLKEIWFSKEFEEIRKKVLMGKKFEYCFKCGLTDMKIKLKAELLERVKNEV